MKEFKTKDFSPFEKIVNAFYAYCIRDLRMKNSNFVLGLFYTFMKPLSILILLTSLRSFGFAGFSWDFIIYYVTFGYIFWFYFSDTANSAVNCLEKHIDLLNLPNIRPIIIILGAIFSNFVLTFGISIILVISLAYFGMDLKIFELLKAFCVLFAFTFSYAFFITVLSHNNPVIQNIQEPLLRLVFFMSSVILPLEYLSEDLQKVLYLNPVAHVIDYLRVSTDTLESRFVDPSYALIWSLGIFLFSMIIFYYKKI